MKYIGVVLEKLPDGKFDVHEVQLDDNGILDMIPVAGGERRNKGSAIRCAELAFVSISQRISRSQIEFDVDAVFEEEEV